MTILLTDSGVLRLAFALQFAVRMRSSRSLFVWSGKSLALLLGLSALAPTTSLAGSRLDPQVQAHIARLQAKAARSSSIENAKPAALGPLVQTLFAAMARHQASFGAPDAGYAIGNTGSGRLEIGAEHFVVRGTDGAARPATLEDLAAAKLGKPDALAGAMSRTLALEIKKISPSLARRKDVVEAAAESLEIGKAKVAEFAAHPDIQRLVRRRLASATAQERKQSIELLDANHDASLRLSGKGKLLFRFGTTERAATYGDLKWLGLTNRKIASEVLGRRVVERSGDASSSPVQVRADQKARHLDDLDRALAEPMSNANLRALSELRKLTKEAEVIVASGPAGRGLALALVEGDAGSGSGEDRLVVLSYGFRQGQRVRASEAAKLFGIGSRDQLNDAVKKAILAIPDSAI